MPGMSIPSLEDRVGGDPLAMNKAGVLDRLVGFRLRLAQMALASGFQTVMQEFDLTLTQFGVLALIAERPGINQTDLGFELGIDRSTMVAVIDRLQGRGLVERHASPRDRRSYALALSDQGRALLNEVVPRVEARDRELIAGLSEDERHQLIAMLSRIGRDGGNGAAAPSR